MKLFRTHFESAVRAHSLSASFFIVYAVSSCQDMHWTIEYISSSGIIARTPADADGTIQEVTVRKTVQGFVIKADTKDNNLADWGKSEKVVQDFEDAFYAQQSMLSPEEIAYRYEVTHPHLMQQNDSLEESVYGAAHPADPWWSILKPTPGYTATPAIVWLNILLFLVMIAMGVSPVEPSSGDIVAWGGNYGPSVADGQFWRLITGAFIHIGFVHLLMNMLALIYAGAFLEPLIGTRLFTTAYVLTAVTGSLFGLSVHPDIVSAGASGAIFGVFGVLTALLTTRLIPPVIRKRLLFLMGYYLIYNLLYGLKAGIDNAAHIGGLLTGLMLGYLFYAFKTGGFKANAQ